MKKFARLFSLLLTLVMLVTLCGCSLLDTLSNLIQKKMSDDQLDAALAKIDAAALAASFSTGANVTGAETVYGYYGKINGGNTTALVCGVPQFNLLLTTGGKKDVNLHLGDGVEFFTDKEGEFYISTVEETVWGRDAAGRESGRTRLTKYNRWNGSDWTPAYTVQDAINSITQVTVTKYFKGDLETQINEEEFKQFTPTAYKTPVGTLNTCTFEATYRDHLVESLDQYLDENYSYHSVAKRNIDADRDNEIIITPVDYPAEENTPDADAVA